VGIVKFHRTPIDGLMIVETAPMHDARGSFDRVFCDAEFAELRPHLRWAQVNLSRTQVKGAIRGMHFQYPPSAEAKLIRCLRGRVLDVAVDVRARSPTFLRWHAVELDARAPLQIFIPEGFAHGFQALTDDVQLLYFHTAPWSREHEGRLRHDDPTLAIRWPLPITEVSDRDRSASLIESSFAGVRSE
jgi:dTDP-4-dehydrorhamnose 3,5-epimerase